MRRAQAWFVVVGVLIGSGSLSTQAKAADGFWVTLATGAANAQSPSDYSEFWFDSPHAPPIAVNQLNGGFSVQATTGGGSTFFTGIGTPVLLPTTDGYATLTNPGVANGSGGLPRFAGGTQASGAPQTGVPLGNANLLTVGLSTADTNGNQVLTVGATDPGGHSLGTGHVTVPGGGWWVIGLGAGPSDSTGGGTGGTGGGTGGSTGGGTGGTGGGTGGTGGGTDGGTGGSTGGSTGGGSPGGSSGSSGGSTGGGTDGGTGTGGSSGGGTGGTVATPEPASLVLLGIGGLGVTAYNRVRRSRTDAA